MAAHHIALAKIPQSTWTKRFLATACVLTGRIDEGGHIFAQIHDSLPALTMPTLVRACRRTPPTWTAWAKVSTPSGCVQHGVINDVLGHPPCLSGRPVPSRALADCR